MRSSWVGSSAIEADKSSARMPSGQFRANAVFFRIGVLAYYGLFGMIHRRIRIFAMA